MFLQRRPERLDTKLSVIIPSNIDYVARIAQYLPGFCDHASPPSMWLGPIHQSMTPKVPIAHSSRPYLVTCSLVNDIFTSGTWEVLSYLLCHLLVGTCSRCPTSISFVAHIIVLSLAVTIDYWPLVQDAHGLEPTVPLGYGYEEEHMLLILGESWRRCSDSPLESLTIPPLIR
jgi:hypothetical protein